MFKTVFPPSWGTLLKEQYLTDKAEAEIKKALHEALVECANEGVSTEDIHIYIEEILGELFEFTVIRECLLKVFPRVQNMSCDSSFTGIAWQTNIATKSSKTDVSTGEDVNLHDLSCEEFAEFISKYFSKRRKALGDIFRNAILDESISATTFVEMTKEELERTFTLYLGSIKYGEGIKMDLQMIQRQIRNAATEVNLTGNAATETLRTFDSPVETKSYKYGIVKPATGNLLTPKHEFVNLIPDKKHYIYFITKDVVRFTAACINGRKNGTIHFGVEPIQNGAGRIVGIPKSTLYHMNLNEEITRALKTCFEKNVSVAIRCVRPVQIVPVEDDKSVIEVDVVPFSCHLNADLLHIKYPPKGSQSLKWFLCDSNEILPVSSSKLNEVRDACAQILKHREYLEKDALVYEKKGNHLQNKLKKLITRGNRYVKDELVPIIISGKISDSIGEREIREQLDVDRAFTAAELVLDFDSSVRLRNKIEENKSSFLVKTAENILHPGKQKYEKTDISDHLPTWLYCNGNDEIQLPAKCLSDWMRERSDGVKNSLSQFRQMIPKERGILIFLVFDTPKQYQEPLFEVARDALLSTFRGECLVISDKDENITYLKQEVTRMFDESTADTCFVTGLGWDEISRIMNTVFRANADVICRLPCSKGHFVEMTLKEKDELKLTEIEILSGEQCIHEAEIMEESERKAKRYESQELFYKGGLVTWWNFYYGNQVGRRCQFDMHRTEIKEKINNEKGEGIIEIHEIEHHPGAGGSTLGRHLIWEFSQFNLEPDAAYRCCVVKTISEETVDQIDRFRSFKDADDTKPFIILIDNESEENVMLLKTKLYELAYKTATPGKLFCLIIIVNRMSITYSKTRGKHLLKHELTHREKDWFENKFKEMEMKGDMDVRTLIAFNCMRNSFDEKYIQETTQRVMQGISTKEIDVLKCLALISTYESDDSVPQNVFDRMMNDQFDLELIMRQPFGIAHHIKELDRLGKLRRQTWNVKLTDAMQLLLTKREHETFNQSGICIVSQLLAKAVLNHIMKTKRMSLEEIVEYVLKLVEEQSTEGNPMSKKFVKIVCSLFKTRQLLDSEKGEAKLKFSDLVLELEHIVQPEEEDDAIQRVLRVLQRCFDITDDAMVGQQLARFNIHIRQFDAAETAIKRSLSIRPQNSYLLDTYGQIFKGKMDYLLETSPYIKNKIPDEVAAEIVANALTAVQKFREGQSLSKKYEEDINWSCFQMEVKIALNLLEKFSKFSCYINRDNFLRFLNDKNFELEGSSFANLMMLCPSLDDIRSEKKPQRHVAMSLRSLEERFYQVKRQLYSIYSESEVLLLKLRERFERFYGTPGNTSHYKFLYGIGLKPLQQAKEKDPKILEKRVREAEENLSRTKLSEADERDLLVYLGTKIISLSNQQEGAEECSKDDYKKLLAYSTRLVNIQSSAKTSERSYLESYLYHAMLHWPLKSRLDMNLEDMSGPTTYIQLMEKWESAFNNNFFLKTTDQIRKNKPKNYFALAKGIPGNDIVDLESIRRQWVEMKKDTGRRRRPVYRDYFWKESFVVERLERLEGFVDGSGYHIIHKVEYPQHGTKTFKINAYYPCIALSNRVVTFVLGFTWRGPTAFDVDEKGRKGQKMVASAPVVDYDDQPSSIEIAGNDDDLESNRTESTVDQSGGSQGACGQMIGPKQEETGDIECSGVVGTDPTDIRESGNTAAEKGRTRRPPWMKPPKKRRHRKK
ncbi:sterile alpha motif domain-containing protein 9-like [Mercenaria mercenaria]|uniref:sterile alpha motif domain-containing protein 9-like n=1 Tax=Mercenaria mercenaria TaxID=6596 RepID=UPI00234F9B0A|nr:sterile alpha motif domain-containing protein 9-like [Mercenaria mercenaria]